MLPFYYLREDKSFFVSVFIQDYDNAIIKRVFISISLGLAFHEWTYAHTTHTDELNVQNATVKHQNNV